MKGRDIYNMMFNYSKLPNKLFYLSKDDTEEESILKSVKNDKVLLVLDFLYNNVNRKEVIKFTLENMIIECGFKLNNHKSKSEDTSKKTNDQFRDILSKLQSMKIITIIESDKDAKTKVDLLNIKPKDLIICTLDIDLTYRYFELYSDEKEKIMNYKTEKIDNLKLLLHYCYIKSRIYKRSKVDGDLVAFGGKAETWTISYDLFKKDLGLVDESIKKYNDILIFLNMIRIGNAGLWHYKDDPMKFVRESSNIYALFDGNEESTKNTLKEGIKGYKLLDQNSNKKFIDSKEYKNNNRKLNGQLGAIIKKEKKGIATPEDIIRKNELLNLIHIDKEQYNLIGILEANEGELLSDIYYNQYDKEEKADEYLQLEKDLGLINEEEELLVDWDYYKWVMSNYEKNKHQYFVNCVAKKINENNKTKQKGLYKNGEKVVSNSKSDEFADIEQEVPQGYGQESWEGNEEVDFSEFMDDEEDVISEEEVQISSEDKTYCSQNYNIEDQIYEIAREKLTNYILENLDDNDVELNRLYNEKFGHIEFFNLQGKEIAETTIKIRKFFDEYASKKTQDTELELIDLDAIAAGDPIINKKTKEIIEKIRWKVNDLGYIESDFDGEDLLIYKTYVKPNLKQSGYRS